MPHILLIEPDKLLGGTYVRALESAGHSVRVCALAQSAISAVDDQRPDIVILEMQLVGHSGAEFLYEFRSYADWQSIPLILLTQVPPAEFTGSRELLYGELGVSTYLYKPQASLQTLLRTVQELGPVGIISADVPASTL